MSNADEDFVLTILPQGLPEPAALARICLAATLALRRRRAARPAS